MPPVNTLTNTETDHLWQQLDAGSPDKVIEALESKEGDLPEPALVLLGLAHLDHGAPHDAIRVFEKAIVANPENIVARLFLTLALHRGGESEAAGRIILDLQPILPHRGYLARFLEDFWPRRAAIIAHSLSKSEADTPPDPDAPEFERLAGNGDHEKQGSPKAAQKLAAKYARRGVTYFHERKISAAHDCLLKAWKLNPADEGVAANAAFTALHCGRADLVEPMLVPFLEKAASAPDPRKAPLPLPDTTVCLAWARHDLGQHEEAMRLLALVEPEGPEDCYTHFLAAVCCLDMGDRDRFRKLLDHGLAYYFIDTWEQILSPFVARTADWLLVGAPEASGTVV